MFMSGALLIAMTTLQVLHSAVTNIQTWRRFRLRISVGEPGSIEANFWLNSTFVTCSAMEDLKEYDAFRFAERERVCFFVEKSYDERATYLTHWELAKGY